MQPLFPLPVVICYWVDVIKEHLKSSVLQRMASAGYFCL